MDFLKRIADVFHSPSASYVPDDKEDRDNQRRLVFMVSAGGGCICGKCDSEFIFEMREEVFSYNFRDNYTE